MFDSRRFRNDFGLKQSELAKLLNVSQPEISRIESAGADLNFEQYRKMCELYTKDVVDEYIIKEQLQEIKNASTSLNAEIVSLLKSQHESIINLAVSIQKSNEKYAQQLDRLMDILERNTDKVENA